MTEGVAWVGGGCQGDGGSSGIGTCAGHAASVVRPDVGRHVIVGGPHFAKDGYVVCVACHRYWVRVLGRAVAPGLELVAAVGVGCQRGHVAIVVAAAAKKCAV